MFNHKIKTWCVNGNSNKRLKIRHINRINKRKLDLQSFGSKKKKIKTFKHTNSKKCGHESQMICNIYECKGIEGDKQGFMPYII